VVPIQAARRWIRPQALTGALLAAAAAIIAVVAIRREEVLSGRVLRESASHRIVALPGEDHLRRDQFRLRWSAGPKGTLYELWVTTPELREVYRAGKLQEAEAQVPATALEAIPPGAAVLWRVEAWFPDGGHVASPAFRTWVE